MRYKILIPILLLYILPAAYADKSVLPLSVTSSTVIKSTINSLSTGRPLKASNSTDPYQYCFNNSTWVVPPQTLLSYLYDNATVTPASDQTVWVTSNYNHGYFSGQSYTSINNSILSQRYLIGSVTSEGKVYNFLFRNINKH